MPETKQVADSSVVLSGESRTLGSKVASRKFLATMLSELILGVLLFTGKITPEQGLPLVQNILLAYLGAQALVDGAGMLTFSKLQKIANSIGDLVDGEDAPAEQKPPVDDKPKA